MEAIAQSFPPSGAVSSVPTSMVTTLISTRVRKITQEHGNVITRMLALQVHPEQIALAVGVSVRSVYCVRENCEANGGIFKISHGPSKAGRPCLISEDDVNVCISHSKCYPKLL